MPALTNVRHENFAQEIAKGTKAGEAYVLAGYKPSAPHASHLQHTSKIVQRVAEIQATRHEIERKATEKAAEALSIDKEWVMQALMEEREAAREAAQHATAVRAIELLGKELGMFIDRKQIDARVTLAQLVLASIEVKTE